MKLIQILCFVVSLMATTSALQLLKNDHQQEMEYVPGEDKYIPVQHHELTTYSINPFKLLPFDDSTNATLIIVIIVILVIIGVILCCCCCACCAFAGAAAQKQKEEEAKKMMMEEAQPMMAEGM